MKLLIKILIIINIVFVSNAQPYKSLHTAKNSAQNWVGNFDILVIRTEFLKDNNNKTTGNGLFKLRRIDQVEDMKYDYFTLFDKVEKESNFILKRNTANKAFIYYDIKEYFSEISNGKFNIENIDISSIIKLERSMSYYGLNDNLGKLAIDTLNKYINASNSYELENYDFIIILHAGYGEEFDLKGDTPNDIISGSVTSNDLSDYGIESYNFKEEFGIKNDGVMILPEFESQDISENEYPQGLLGPAAFTFGTFLGMDHLYDGTQETSGVGFWGLMGWGWINFSGYIPSHPLGFQKYNMGWIDDIVPLEKNGTYNLHSNGCYKVIAQEDDEFIIEFKNIDNKYESGIEFYLYRYDFKENEIIDSQKYHILEDNYKSNRSGLLIYHLNKKLIGYLREYDHPLIMGKDKKGIDIEEADGLNDLNKRLGLTGSFGDLYDLFKNNAYFTEKTHPNTNTYDNKKSLINIKNINQNENYMSLTLKNYRLNYFPLKNDNINMINNKFYVKSKDKDFYLYKHDKELIKKFENEEILELKNNFIITNYGIYKYSNNNINLVNSFNTESTHVISNFQYLIIWDKNDNSNIYKYNIDQINFIKNYNKKIESFFILDNYYYIKDNILYKNNSFYENNIHDYFIKNENLFYLKDNVFYHYKKGDDKRLFSFSDDVDDYIVIDYDNDNTDEFIIKSNNKLIIANIKGEIEKKYITNNNIKDFNLILENETIFLLVLGENVMLYNISENNEKEIAGSNINYTKVSDNSIIYGNDQYYYSIYKNSYNILRENNYLKEFNLKDIKVAKEKLFLYPNPTSQDYIKINYNNSKSLNSCEIKIYDESMNSSMKMNHELLSGDNIIKIDIKSLKIGTYILFFNAGDTTRYLKFSKVR
ncbi:MAG: hypothetical protein FXF47_04440 [Candidatus Mcinerneyibacterium aminivorans]|uniref:Uncharacterized protein n=1 Tax=Candidatus Mcinerneyibacterium aminivorans TaxID=2703815 RepID=A0A5D0MG51_9BACT|nr:MAG: hypothetical protein FXF47_04440 [Candidatus Mcinerneyibacterium aminivorans]